MAIPTKHTLTNRFIETLTAPAKGYTAYWDDKLIGFGLRIQANGHKFYIVQYRNRFGTSRRFTIGQHGAFTPIQAREQAQQLLAAVKRGEDPAQEKRNLVAADSFSDLCEQYMEKHARIKKKPRSIKADEWMLKKYVLPHFGTRKVMDMTRNDIHQLHFAMRETPYTANRVLELLSKMFNLAEKWGIRPDHSNPTRHVEAYPEHKRERYLDDNEIARLNGVLSSAEAMQTESPQVVAAFRLLLLTGCRLGEIQTLKWDYVDFSNACLRLPDSKTGAKIVQLNAPALQLLSTLKRLDGNPFVIFGKVAGAHITDLQHPWRRIRQAAELNDVRIHDLRHTFASVAIGMGESLPMIGKLLGHTQMQTTHRYAHLANAPQKQSSERIGAALAGMMDKKQAEILCFPNSAIG